TTTCHLSAKSIQII
ncbi:EAL domain protein, partial [Vibrio parahaemolyticus EKP-028]